jgi:N-methylhydantoinase A
MRLDVERARRAIERDVAIPLGLTVDEAAWSIHRVVNANMARAAHVHCLEHGVDVRDFCVFAYGGAGPIHAYGVAQSLGSRQLIYPLRAGVLSAFGFLVAEPAFELVHGQAQTLRSIDCAGINTLLEELASRAQAVVASSVAPGARFVVERSVALRYAGQSFELYVALPEGKVGPQALLGLEVTFAARYRERYHAEVEHGQVETVRWKVRVRGIESKPPLRLGSVETAVPAGAQSYASGGEHARVGERRAWIPEAEGFAACPVYDRYRLTVGVSVPGPALFEEHESTVFIGQGARAEVMGDGALRVDVARPMLTSQSADDRSPS